MFSSVRVQFTKFCPVCIPFMNTCVQFMFSSRKKYVNTKRFWTVIVLFSCFRTDLTRALLRCCCAATASDGSSSSSRLLRSDPSWQPTFLATRSTCRSILHRASVPTRTSRLRLLASETRRASSIEDALLQSPSAGRTDLSSRPTARFRTSDTPGLKMEKDPVHPMPAHHGAPSRRQTRPPIVPSRNLPTGLPTPTSCRSGYWRRRRRGMRG